MSTRIGRPHGCAAIGDVLSLADSWMPTLLRIAQVLCFESVCRIRTWRWQLHASGNCRRLRRSPFRRGCSHRCGSRDSQQCSGSSSRMLRMQHRLEIPAAGAKWLRQPSHQPHRWCLSSVMQEVAIQMCSRPSPSAHTSVKRLVQSKKWLSSSAASSLWCLHAGVSAPTPRHTGAGALAASRDIGRSEYRWPAPVRALRAAPGDRQGRSCQARQCGCQAGDQRRTSRATPHT